MKLAIRNEVTVPVKFFIKDGAKTLPFSLSLVCARISGDEFQAGIRDEQGNVVNAKVRDKLLSLTTGWTDQTFVLEDDGTPAVFGEDAFNLMMDVPGVLDVAAQSYVKESSAKAKN